MYADSHVVYWTWDGHLLYTSLLQTEIVYRFFLLFVASSFYVLLSMYILFTSWRSCDVVALHAKSFCDLPNACGAEFLLDFYTNVKEWISYIRGGASLMFYLHIRNGMNFGGGCIRLMWVDLRQKSVLNISKCIGFDWISQPGAEGKLYSSNFAIYNMNNEQTYRGYYTLNMQFVWKNLEGFRRLCANAWMLWKVVLYCKVAKLKTCWF